MSGRIRTIKPELLEDAVTAGLSDMAFRIFVSTISLADDYGRLRAEPSWLLGQIYWARSVVVADFVAALGELDKLIQFYEVNGQRYAWIRNWAKHQKVSHPAKPRIPLPPENLPKPSGGSPENPETLRPDLRPPTSDHGPPTTDPDRVGGGEPEDRKFEVGTAGAVEARACYVDAMSAATSRRYALPRSQNNDRDLCDLLNAHGPPSKRVALAWLVKVAAEWVNAADATYTCGWSPSKLLAWLNAGRPDKRSKGAKGAEVTKQPFDPEASWMKVGDTGS